MFKVGDIVKYAPEWCGVGEEKYISKVLEVNEVTGNIIIGVLNTSLVLGSTECVKDYMIVKYEDGKEGI